MHRMSGVFRRIFASLATLWLVSLAVFVGATVLPGNTASAILGKEATPDAVEQLTNALNLNEPLWRQYLKWLQGLLTGNPGMSLATRGPLMDLVWPALKNSLALLAAAGVVSVGLGVILGTLSAARPGTIADRLTNSILLVFAAIPEFVLGLLLAILLSTTVFHILPSVTLLPPGTPAWRQPVVLVLPTLTLVGSITPYTARISRAAVSDALKSEYVTMGELRGLGRTQIVLQYGLRNSIAPIIQAAASSLAFMLGGLALVESVFNYPGIGTLLVSSIANRDIPVVEFLTLISAAGYLIFNLVADAVTVAAVPKLRTRAKRS